MDKEAIKKEVLYNILTNIKILTEVCYKPEQTKEEPEQTKEENEQYGCQAYCSTCESYPLCIKLFGLKMPHDILKD